MKKGLNQVWTRLRGRLRVRSIVSHVLAIVLIGIAATSAFLIVAAVLQERGLALAEEERQLADHYRGFTTSVEDRAAAAMGLALAFGRNAAIQSAVAEADRAALLQLTLPAWLEIESKVGMSIGQFHLSPATSLLRLHATDKHGDDLSGFRQSVVDTIALRQAVSGLEWGRGGLAIRSVVPVWHGPSLAGSVEFGDVLDDAFLRDYTEGYQIEVEIYVTTEGRGPGLPTLDAPALPGTGGAILRYASTLRTPLATPADAVGQVLETGEAQIQRFSHEGEPVAVYLGPLYDYSDRVIGATAVVRGRREVLSRINRAGLVNTATGLIAMLVVGVIAYRSTKHLIAPVAEMSRSAQRAATGDLDVKIPVRRQNELGQLAIAFNTMIDGLRALLLQVSGASRQLSDSGERLAVEMEEMNSSVEQVSIAVGELARGAGIQAVRVEEASHVMGELAAATGQIAQNARTTGEVSVQARALVDEAREVSRKLEARARRIEAVVVAVDKVADQTNLLALNASIEAARAGEAGLGFAVVAQEVRRLAESSVDLVGEIAELSQAIGDDLKMVWDKMDAAQAAVDQATSLAQETAIATQGQEDSSDAMVVAINEIATVAEQSAASTEEIAVTVEQQVASIDHIAAAAQTLAELAGQLRESVSRLEHEGASELEHEGVSRLEHEGASQTKGEHVSELDPPAASER